MLVAFRALQAVGAAAMTPTSLGILLATLPPERRLVGVRVWAAVGAVAAAIGPTVGGLLTELSWRWVFLINVPVGPLILVAAARVVRDEPVDSDAPTPDLLGAGLIAPRSACSPSAWSRATSGAGRPGGPCSPSRSPPRPRPSSHGVPRGTRRR